MASGRRNTSGLVSGGVVAMAAALTAMGLVESAFAAGKVKVERVTRGSAQFNQVGSVLTIRAADRTIINYRQFDVGAGQTVRFVQPTRTSKVLNRINAVTPSKIDGTIQANGIVYFVNPSGILFGAHSVVNVGQIYAAAGNLSDANFLNNVNQFKATGAVVNAGVINGDAVALIGRTVANAGTISAEGGLVTMVAGDDVMIGTRDGHIMVKVGSATDGTPGSVTNTGAVRATTATLAGGDMYALAIGGSVRAKSVSVQGAGRGTVAVTGTIDASDQSAGGKGGSVVVTGEKVNLQGAMIDASGDAGGGTVLVGGDMHGQGAVRTATETVVDNGTTITASATGNGNGGKVVVWADTKTTYNGSIYAKGGATGGDGGAVEVSGKGTLAFNGAVDTTAPAGQIGSLLLDPTNIAINASNPDVNGDGTPGDDVTGDISAGDPGTNSVITSGALVTLLNTTDVSLAATNDINVNAAVDATGNAGSHALTLDAGHDINVNASIQLNNNDLTLTAVNRVLLGADINTHGGDAFIAVSAGDIVRTAGTATVDHLTMEAATGIGTTLAPVLTVLAGGLEAHATAGDIAVSNSALLNVGFTGGTKNGVVAEAGNVALTGVGVNLTTAGHALVASGNVSVTSVGGDIVTNHYSGAAGGGQIESTGGSVSIVAISGNIRLGATTQGDVHSASGLSIQAIAGGVTIDNGSYVKTDGGALQVTAATSVSIPASGVGDTELFNDGANGTLTISAPSFIGNGGGLVFGVHAGGDVTIKADTVDFSDHIGSGSGAVAFTSFTAGRAISLADAPVGGELTLTGTQLALVSVGTALRIGDATSGNISVTSDVVQSAGWNALHLVSNGSISDASGGSLQVDNLAAEAQTGVDLSNQTQAVGTLAASTLSGGVALTNGQTLTIGTAVDGVSGVIVTGGDVTLNANGATSDLVTGGSGTAVQAVAGSVSLHADRDVLIGPVDFGDVLAATGLTLDAAHDVTIDNASGVETSGGNIGVTAANAFSLLQTSTPAAHLWNTGAGGTITVTALTFVAQSGGSPASIQTVGAAGSIEIVADDVNFSDAIVAGGGLGRLTFRSNTAGLGITLADAPVVGQLTLTGTELGLVSASVVQIGDVTAGDISVAGTIAQGANWNTLDLETGAGISDVAGGTLSVDNFRFVAGAAVNLGTQTHALGTVAGLSNGAITITTSGTLTVGTVDTQVGLNSSNGAIALTADGMEITQAVNAGTGIATFANLTAGVAIDIGGAAADGANLIGLSQAEFDLVTASAVRIGSATAGDVNVVSGDLNNAAGGWNVLHLITGGNVAEAGAAITLTGGALAVEAGGSIDLSNNNQVATFAGTAGTTLTLNTTSDLAIDVVDGVTGITAAGDVGLTAAAGGITVNQAVATDGGDFTATATGLGGTFTAVAPDGTISTVGANPGDDAGDVTITALGVVNIGTTITATGNSNATGNGGNGGTVQVSGSDVELAAVLTAGGAAAANDDNGGDGGDITVTATSGNITLDGDLNAPGGTGFGAGTDGVAGDVMLQGPVVLGNTITVTGHDVEFFSTIQATTDGGQGLTVDSDAGGSIIIDGAVGGAGHNLAFLTLNGAGAETIGGSVSTTGNQVYTGPVTLASDTTITTTIGTVEFQSTVDGTTDGGQSLAVDAGGLTTFLGAVGGTHSLSALTVSGASDLNGSTVVTTGAQEYMDAVTLSADTTLTTSDVGAGITFDSTVDGDGVTGRSLTLHNAGVATFGGTVGGTTALAFVAVDGASAINGGGVTTTGAQTYTGAATIGANTTLTGSLTTFGSTLNGAFTLAILGDAAFNGVVGGVSPALVSLNVSGTTAMNAGTVTTSADQTYTGLMTLGSNTVLVGVNLALNGGVTGATHDLALQGTGETFLAGASGVGALTSNSGGHTTFGGPVSAASVLVTDAIALNGTTVTTTGTQGYSAAATLGTDNVLTGTAITFASTVDSFNSTARSLHLVNSGLATLGGNVGLVHPLAALTIDGATTVGGGGSIVTVGNQNYGGAFNTAVNLALTGQAITFSSTVRGLSDGGQSLTVHNSGLLTFNGAVGDGGERLSLLLVDGATAINTSTVTTSTTQIYTGAVTVGANSTLTGSAMTFSSTLDDTADGLHSLTLTNSGVATFNGVVGGIHKLGSLSVAGASAINGGAVTTAGAQTYSGAVSLGLDTTLTGSMMTFGQTVDGPGRALTLNGATTFHGSVGTAGYLASLTANGTTLFDGNGGSPVIVDTAGGQTYTGAATVGTDTTLVSTGGAVAFGATLDSDVSGANALVVNSNTLTVAGKVGGIHPLGSMNMVTTGDQTYASAVIVGGSSTFRAGSVSFSYGDDDTIDSNVTPGVVTFGGNLTTKGNTLVYGGTGVRFNGEVVGTDADVDTLTVQVPNFKQDTPSTMVFNAPASGRADVRNFKALTLENPLDAKLRNADRVPAVATIAATSADGFSVRVTDAFTMGRDEKLTATKGNIRIALTGADGVATIGDLSALGSITVVAPGSIRLQQRPASIVKVRGADGTLVDKRDAGLDLVAGGGAVVLDTPVLRFVGPVQSNTFVVFSSYNSDAPDAGLVHSLGHHAIELNTSERVAAADLIGPDGIVLDLGPLGTSIVDPSVARAAASHIDQIRPTDELGISSDALAFLADIGVRTREVTNAERMDGLEGRDMYVQSPEVLLQVAIPRLNQTLVQEVVATYTNLFVKEVQGDGGRTAKASRRAEIHDVLTKAVEAYTASHPGDVDPAGFRQFVNTTPDQKQALDYMNRLRTLLKQLEALGLTGHEMHDATAEVCRDVTPAGMTQGQFVAAVMAPGGTPTVASR